MKIKMKKMIVFIVANVLALTCMAEIEVTAEIADALLTLSNEQAVLEEFAHIHEKKIEEIKARKEEVKHDAERYHGMTLFLRDQTNQCEDLAIQVKVCSIIAEMIHHYSSDLLEHDDLFKSLASCRDLKKRIKSLIKPNYLFVTDLDKHYYDAQELLERQKRKKELYSKVDHQTAVLMKKCKRKYPLFIVAAQEFDKQAVKHHQEWREYAQKEDLSVELGCALQSEQDACEKDVRTVNACKRIPHLAPFYEDRTQLQADCNECMQLLERAKIVISQLTNNLDS